MKIERNIIAPFCVFFIIMGMGGVIIRPIAMALGVIEETGNILFKLSWVAGAFIALLYSLIVLKEFLRKSFAEKALYIFLAILFIILLAFPLLLLKA